MNSNEMKDWLKLLYDELPSVVKPLFFLSVYMIAFLIIGNNLELNDSLLLITKEKIFNLAFYLGIYTLVFRALNKAFQKYKKMKFAREYPTNKLNKDYFLGQYKNHDEVYIFELKSERKKLWISNLQTKRSLWGQVSAEELDPTSKKITLEGKDVNLTRYPNKQKYDGQIDILILENKEILFLAITSLSVIFVVIISLNLFEIWKFILPWLCA